MSYKVRILDNKPFTVATMKMTIPDYSTDLAIRAVRTMKKELESKGINALSPEYNFLVSYDSSNRLEVIDIEINVGVVSAGNDSEMIHFHDLPEVETLIRIEADDFEEIHIGLAEWMHDHDYVADGGLRTIIHEGSNFIYDCPVKPAED